MFTLLPPYSLFPVPCSLFPVPCSLPVPLNPKRKSLRQLRTGIVRGTQLNKL
ncbi:hypothetical protein [Moorena producens]|uniref:hypothetical protein n=1 Tax=Moorena producens TaxID=1155739 RepID=UPI000A78E135|nr:hypothetical protein [Moorena producens]